MKSSPYSEKGVLDSVLTRVDLTVSMLTSREESFEEEDGGAAATRTAVRGKPEPCD